MIVKEKKITIKQRWFYYIVMEFKNEVAIVQRTGKDIWKDLFEFPLIEVTKEMNEKNIIKQLNMKEWFATADYTIENISPLFKQQLSHQSISGKFITIKLKRKIKLKSDWRLVTKERLKNFAFPQFINQYLKTK